MSTATTKKTTTTTRKKETKPRVTRRFKTPEAMKLEIEQFFDDCTQREEIPLLSWMESKLKFRFKEYDARPEYTTVTTWAREESQARCEQLAFRGKMSKVAARLYLNCKCGYVERSKLEVEGSQTINMYDLSNLLKEVDNMDQDKQRFFDELIRKRVADGANNEGQTK